MFTQLDPKSLFFLGEDCFYLTGQMCKNINRYRNTNKSIWYTRSSIEQIGSESGNASNLNLEGAWFKSWTGH